MAHSTPNTLRKTRTPKSKISRVSRKKDLAAWLLMLPSLALFAFFVWEPLLETVHMSFYKVKGVTLENFVGLKNYLTVLKHPVFAKALPNTIMYTVWSLVIGFFVPILIAALITETVHLKGLFRVGVYFPNIIPGIAALLILTYFFGSGDTGVLNILLNKIGLGPLPWLTNARWTIPLIVLAMTWKSAGSTALIYMAGIAGINPEMYEAATLDGANPLQRFFFITLPCIFNLGKTMLIMQIIAVFQILYEPLMMTNGGPNNASISLMQLVYRFAFEEYKYAQAAALSVMICLILIVLTAVYFKVAKTTDNE